MKSIFVFLCLIVAVPAFAVPRKFYIDFAAGSDATSVANAQSKTTPWKHAPYMTGSTISGYSHVATDQFIFKGGVTWDKTCFPMTIAAGGSGVGSEDYYGVDATWYSGATWAQPIFSNGGTNSNNFITINANNVVVDNIEMTAFYWTTSADVHYVWMAQSTNVTLQNCYLHGWSHGGSSDCLKVVGSDQFSPFTWGDTQYVVGCTFDSYPGDSNSGWAVKGGVGNLINCTIRNCTNGFLPGTNNGLASGNNIGPINASFDGTVHTNGIENNTCKVTLVIKNNYIHDTSSGTTAIFVGDGGAVTYCYNNVLWNIGGNYPISLEVRGTASSFYIDNNTIVANGSIACIGTSSSASFTLLSCHNNFCITSNASVVAGSPNPVTNNSSNNLLKTAAQAATDGFSSATNWAPSSSAQLTYNTGATIGYFSTDAIGITRPQNSTWDIGAYEFVSSGDSTAPTVTITVPNSSGSNIQTTSSVTISGIASDNAAVSSVAVVMSGATTGSVSITGTTSWTGTAIVNLGATTFTATATDSSANTGTDTHITTYTVITPARTRRGGVPILIGVGF